MVSHGQARSLIRMSACKYTCVVSVDSWPSHSAITVRSTPRRSRAIAACRNVCGVTFLALSGGQVRAADATWRATSRCTASALSRRGQALAELTAWLVENGAHWGRPKWESRVTSLAMREKSRSLVAERKFRVLRIGGGEHEYHDETTLGNGSLFVPRAGHAF